MSVCLFLCLILFVGMFLEIEFCRSDLNLSHILSILLLSRFSISLYVILRSFYIFSHLAFEYFRVVLGFGLQRRSDVLQLQRAIS